MNQFTEILVQLVSITGGTFAGFLVGKRKYQKEVESITIQNVEKAVEVYKTTIDDMRTWQAELTAKLNRLEHELHHCKEEMEKTLQKAIRQNKQ